LAAPVTATAGAAAGAIAGSAAGVVAGVSITDVLFSEDESGNSTRGSGFANKRTLQQTTIKGNRVSVDAERGGSGKWNVHVKVNGEKVYIRSPSDLSALPKSVRRSSQVEDAVQEAFDYIQRVRQ